MNKSKAALLITYHFIQVKENKHYSHPSTTWFLDQLKWRYGICIGKRWFYQCVKDLSDEGFIKRFRRWIKMPDGLARSRSGNIYLLPRALKYLKVRGIEKSGECLSGCLKWLKGNKLMLLGPSDTQDLEGIMKAKGVLAKLPEFIKPIP
jgi:hypothetical protein